MKKKIIFWGFLLFIIAGCSTEHEKDSHEAVVEKPKIKITAYTDHFELFAEADPLVAGKKANILSHLTFLSDFKPIESGSVKLRLMVGGSEKTQTLDKPTRKGIYSFDIIPGTAGKGQLIYEITVNQQQYQIIVPDVVVYQDEPTAFEEARKSAVSRTNTVVFTKEQSWKIDFSTELPVIQPFGQVIKTTALIQPAQGDEEVITAKTNGLVVFSQASVLEGQQVSPGKSLFTISGSGLADNNATVRFQEAKNNYERAKADYERQAELVKEQIVSAREFAKSKNDYENARSVYENLNKNFNSTGQSVTSPMAGFIKQLFVQNGQFVETGQPLLSVSQNKTLLIRADVQQKYAAILGSIVSANIRAMQDNKTYTLEQLNGKVLSYGRNANDDNYLIPVNLQIDNKGGFVPGSFVELYLKTQSTTGSVTVPNSSLMEEQGNYFVFVQVNPELFEKRLVKPGQSDGMKTEIREGLLQNDRLVTNGAIIIKLSQASGTLDAHAGHVH